MKKILIVDEDSQIQKTYGERFTKEGYQVIQASTGRQGLNLARSNRPDAILLDVMLPGKLNGFDVLEQLKTDRELYQVPVLMITNLDTEADTAKRIGAAGYIVKASTAIDDVVARVKSLL